MIAKGKAACAVAFIALVAAVPAFGTVTLNFVAQDTVIPLVGNTANVEIRADFTEDIVAWGFDLNVADPGVADLIGFTIGPLWDPALSTIDGDLLGGTSLLGVPAGSNILLATLTFQAFGIGITPISLSVSGEEDEGFALGDLSGLDSVVYANGTIRVPEPASLALLALGGLVALRRRA